MPFVRKDAAGNILAVYTEPVEGGQEVAPDDPALKAFIQKTCQRRGRQRVDGIRSRPGPGHRGFDRGPDRQEIDHVYRFSQRAQRKLLDRRGLRKEFDLVEDLFGEGEDDNFDAIDTGDDTDRSGLYNPLTTPPL